jgi:aconitate hydratase
MITEYLKAQGLYRIYDGSVPDPDYSGDIMVLDLATVKPCLSGPKRPHDRVDMEAMQTDF